MKTLLMLPAVFAVTGSALSDKPTLVTRATCRYIQAVSNDGCYALAQRCGITQPQFESYNAAGTCNNVQVDNYYCCSSGTLPDFTPQPEKDGSCKTYTVVKGDICDTIAKKNQMTTAQIEERNKNTWSFAGCKYLYATQKICLSTGSPPMPNKLDNAVCGPQVPGTPKPSNMNTLALLNPCPLNACCDKFGQCGITSEFCVISQSDTGAPGTSKAGTNGCISNCGTSIVNKGSAPASFSKIGYYEAFSTSRKCLAMRPSQIPLSGYTHIHYAFGDISPSFDVDMGKDGALLEEFKQLKGVKRIMSFGGWAFSTEPGTAAIFRQGVTNAQRETFATNVVSFITRNGLDGLDFDWEYPGAVDIPNSPPGSKSDGPNYLAFLKSVKSKLPAGKTLSIAAPASYWYLRNFPIKDMAPLLDYIVYMTYDMHGQWDYGNNFTSPGCKDGNCLRSQTNLTETLYALSMITKAGVPTNKLMMGMPLYGRSFKMSQPGCYTDMCRFTGPNSGATPGDCTGTQGYISNVELRKILANPNIPKQEYTSEVAGDILVYNSDQWVSWMKPATYEKRAGYAKLLNMAGLSDWAIDLNIEAAQGPPTNKPTTTNSVTITNKPTPTNSATITNKPTPTGSSTITTASFPNGFDYPCSHHNAAPGQGITSGYCVCDGSTFSETRGTTTTPYNECAYTTKPTKTISITTDQTISTDIAHCKVCTTIGHNQECSTIPTPTCTPAPEPRCLTAHIYLRNCALEGDVMSLQLWENGKLQCKGSPVKQLASDSTTWDFDCDGGAHATITGNGRFLHYKSTDGWEQDIKQTHLKESGFTCGNFGDTVIKGTEFEYSHATDDECDKRGCPKADLCDFKSFCPEFDATCKG